MKFDIVLGNPPYNKALDIEFASEFRNKANKICFITPAKWKHDERDVYMAFKRMFIKHISHICYWPDCSEIFQIRNCDGITYYLIDNNREFDKCKIENKSEHNKWFNSTVERNIESEKTSLYNIGQEVIDTIGDRAGFMFPIINANARYKIYMGNKIIGALGFGYTDRDDPCGTYGRDGKTYGISRCDIFDSQSEDYEEQISKLTPYNQLIFTSNSMEECKSFESFTHTKLVRFLVMMNVCRLTNILTNEQFKYVPNIQHFDKTYNDEMLYKMYGLSDRCIQAIEDTIKDKVTSF